MQEITRVILMVAGLALLPVTARGQNSAFKLPRDSALSACTAAVAKGDNAYTKAVTEEAERHYRRQLEAHPFDPDVKLLLARTLSQCRTSYAGVFSLEGIVAESNDLLQSILKGDSTNWGARYTLALNYYHAPSFFRQQDDAIREFERLIAQQGSSVLYPELAKPFVYLGDLYLRSNRRPDALALWQRGARLFPGDSVLIRRLTTYARRDTLE